MKKITSIFILLVFVMSVFSAIAETNADANTDIQIESESDLSTDVAAEARAKETVPLCVRFLSEKYPRARPARLQAICTRLKSFAEKADSINTSKNDGQAIRKDRFMDIASRLNLGAEDLEKIKLLGRARAQELVGMTKAEVAAELRGLKVMKLKTEDMFRARVVAADRLKAAKERFDAAKDRYLELKAEFKEEKDAFKDAVESGDEEGAMTHAKAFLLKAADMIIESLEKIKARVEDNDDLTDEEASEIIADIDAKIDVISDAKADVEAATTKEEIKEAGKVIIDAWSKMKVKVKLHAGRIIKSKVRDVLQRAEQLETRLENALGKLEEKGIDTSDLEESIDEYSAKIDDAREKFKQADEKFDEAISLKETDATQDEIDSLVAEGKELVKDAHEDLKDAHEILKDILEQVRDTAGSVDAVAEASAETTVVVDEDEESDLEETSDDDDAQEAEDSDEVEEEEVEVEDESDESESEDEDDSVEVELNTTTEIEVQV